MRFQFDDEKSREAQQKHGVSLDEVQEIFDQAHIIDRKNDDPEQFRAIGWCRGRLCSVIFESSLNQRRPMRLPQWQRVAKMFRGSSPTSSLS